MGQPLRYARALRVRVTWRYVLRPSRPYVKLWFLTIYPARAVPLTFHCPSHLRIKPAFAFRKAASAAGVQVVLNSGRMTVSMEFAADLLDFDVYLVSYNGAVVAAPRVAKVRPNVFAEKAEAHRRRKRES